MHLTHVGFNSDTGECKSISFFRTRSKARADPAAVLCTVTGLPKEWQQTLQANGVTREEQEKNPQAVSYLDRFKACYL